MKRILLVFVLSLVFPVLASAAESSTQDWAGRPVTNWGGFYAGLTFGRAWENTGSNSAFSQAYDHSFDVIDSNRLANRSFQGGVDLGYNFQLFNKMVFGIEGDWIKTNNSDEFCRQTDTFSADCTDNNNGFLSLRSKTDWLSTLRGRMGYAFDDVLLYGTGGVAVSQTDTSIGLTCLANGCGTGFDHQNFTKNFSDLNVGYSIGAGAEWAFAGNWRTRLEYMHYHIGSPSEEVHTFDGTVGDQYSSWKQISNYDVVRVGLNYRFGE